MIDWSKPIVFENGQSCRLVETRPGGFDQFGPGYTRMIERMDEDHPMTRFWFVGEDGPTGLATEGGYRIVNQPEEAMTTPKPATPPEPKPLTDSERRAEIDEREEEMFEGFDPVEVEKEHPKG